MWRVCAPRGPFGWARSTMVDCGGPDLRTPRSAPNAFYYVAFYPRVKFRLPFPLTLNHGAKPPPPSCK
eukprot:228450-Chlamydomonas_euryale.AAC.5